MADWEQGICRRRCYWLVDAKSVEEHLVKDTGTPSDKRLGIEGASLRQLLCRGGEDAGDMLLWVDTAAQLADCLTKEMDGSFLEQAVVRGVYRIKPQGAVVEAEKRKAAARRARKHGAPAGEAGSAGKE